MNASRVRNLLLVLLAIAAVIGFSHCGSAEDDDRGDFPEDDGPNGGGSGGDDDDDDDNDTSDDDDDDTPPRALLIYSYDDGGATSLRTVIESFEYEVDLLLERQIDEESVLGYDVIVAHGDTGWVSQARVDAVAAAATPILGFYYGGALLFRALGLSLNNSGVTDFSSEKGPTVYDANDRIWSYPNDLNVATGTTVYFYSVVQFCPARPLSELSANVLPVGIVENTDEYVAMGLENGAYFYWCYETNTDYLNALGRGMLENVLRRLTD